MVDPLTLGGSLGLGGFGVYLLNRYWQQRQAQLRAQAMLEKYSTQSRIGLHQGRMRLLVSMPQVGELLWRNKRLGGSGMSVETSIFWTLDCFRRMMSHRRMASPAMRNDWRPLNHVNNGWT